MGSVRLEAAMGGKDPLVEHIVEANAYFEVARWLAEWKVKPNLQRRSHG